MSLVTGPSRRHLHAGSNTDRTEMKLPIYMDYHATTPVDPRVLEAMLPFFPSGLANPASRNHAFGWEAEEAVEHARKQVADLIGANPKEVIFTSGATEANNLAIKGVAEMYREKGNHIITCVTEHKAVIDTCKKLEKQGARVTYLPVQKDGRISLDDLRAAITEKTILITIMTANNEIGVLQPIEEIGAIAKEKGILFHTDAVQAVGKVPFDVNKAKADLVSMSAHKMYGPKGVGALYVRRRNPRVLLAEQISGGGHERGMRSGTLERAWHRRLRQGRRAVPARDGQRHRAPGQASRSAEQEAAREPRRDLHQRLDGTSAAAQPQHQLRLRRRRVAADGDQRRGGVIGLGLHLGESRAVIRVEGAWRRRRPGALVDPIRSRAGGRRKRKWTTWSRS